MFGRILFAVIGLVSLIWIGYVSIDLVNRDDRFNPTMLFSKTDGTVLVINDHSKTSDLLAHFQTTASNREIIEIIDEQFITSSFVSEKRDHLLLNSKKVLNPSMLKNLFRNHSNLKEVGAHSFEINGYKGEYYKNACYLTKQKFTPNAPKYDVLVFDKNSAGSIFQLDKKSYSTTDLYIKANGLLVFKSRFNGTIFGGKVNDGALFSSVISSRISSYEFFEVDYLRSTDPVFASSIMNDWVKYGIVKVTLDGKTALITDQQEGQYPINVLCDALQREPQNEDNEYFESIPFTNSFKVTNGFYVFQLDDYVVISEDKTTCENILADYKLGNTISHNASKRSAIYDGLPKKVNHRLVKGKIKQASSVFKSTLLTSSIGMAQAETTIPTQNISNKGVDISEAIKDFYAINEQKLFVETASKKIVFIEDGAKKWDVQLEGNIIESGEIIDLFANDKHQLLIATDKKIHLLDVNGNEVSGFPIDLENEKCTKAPLFYRWQGAGFFVVPLSSGKLMQYDTGGRELNPIQPKLKKMAATPVIWVSANTPYLGIYDGAKFEMINLLNRKSFRQFNAPNVSHFAKITNEVILFGTENNQLISYNQKGSKTIYGAIGNGEIHSIFQQANNPTIIVKTNSKIQLFNTKGIEWGTVQLPFSEIDAVSTHSLSNGNLIISAVDGLENNVHLYTSSGKKWKSKNWEGSKKATFFESGGASFKVITIVDKLIVTYNEN